MLIGTKSDLVDDRKISQREARDLAGSYNADYFEFSGLASIEHLFTSLLAEASHDCIHIPGMGVPAFVPDRETTEQSEEEEEEEPPF